jgi:hypothetical protein
MTSSCGFIHVPSVITLYASTVIAGLTSRLSVTILTHSFIQVKVARTRMAFIFIASFTAVSMDLFASSAKYVFLLCFIVSYVFQDSIRIASSTSKLVIACQAVGVVECWQAIFTEALIVLVEVKSTHL